MSKAGYERVGARSLAVRKLVEDRPPGLENFDVGRPCCDANGSVDRLVRASQRTRVALRGHGSIDRDTLASDLLGKRWLRGRSIK